MITSSCRQVLSSFLLLLLFVLVVIIFVLVVIIIILNKLSLRTTAKQSRCQDRTGAVHPPIIQIRCRSCIHHSFPYSLLCAAHFGWLESLMSFTIIL
jgi:hypothetical protein